MIEWLKWYLSVPIKALASVIIWIVHVHTRVRAKWQSLDLQTFITWATIVTAVAWVVIFFIADEADRTRLTDSIKSMMGTLGN